MSFNANFRPSSALVKPIAIIVIVALAIAGAYVFFGKKSNNDEKSNSQNAQEIKSSGLDPDKRIKTVSDVEEVMAKWVEANPQAIINSVANMQRKAMEEQMQKAQQNIGSKKDQIFANNAPSYAPKGYDVTIVEFYDYNCGYCKRANPSIEQLIKADAKVRVIYRDFPILGQASEDLAKVSLAVYLADSASFKKFHNKLMSSNINTKDGALKAAKELGIDVKKVESTLSSKSAQISEMINNNRMLGSEVGIQGTPAFVIGEELVPGAIDVETLKAKVAAQRNK